MLKGSGGELASRPSEVRASLSVERSQTDSEHGPGLL